MLYNMFDLSLLDLALLCHPILALVPTLSSKPKQRAFKRPYIALSFLVLLACRYYTTAATQPPSFTATQDASHCKTHDLPNPIAHLYPTNATGTLNGTLSILPIPLTLARTLIPTQYTILTAAYTSLLPTFPADMYPALLQAVHDHDVQAFGYIIPDFSRAGIEFPFLDMFGDGTSYKWAPTLLMSAGHEIALQGARDYGTETFPSTFEPECDAYRAAGQGKTVFEARSQDGEAFVETLFEAVGEAGSDGMAFWRNVTNQPTFADGRSCDNMIRLFNTSVTTGIERVKGSVRARIPPFRGEEAWEGVDGIRLDSAFIENNYLPCEGFRGYGEA